MIRHRGPPSQNWRTFLRNHADASAAIDLCVVPTLTFERLFAFLVVGHGRRQLLWFAVTRHPTAEWVAQQIVEAFPWDKAPGYLIRDNDGAYGEIFTNRLRTMGIRDHPISPRSPWQNPYVERLIGTLRRECLDHLLVFGEQHLRQVPSARFPAPIGPKSRAMPPQDRVRPNDAGQTERAWPEPSHAYQ
jgi:transposase InsO family protein